MDVVDILFLIAIGAVVVIGVTYYISSQIPWWVPTTATASCPTCKIGGT